VTSDGPGSAVERDQASEDPPRTDEAGREEPADDAADIDVAAVVTRKGVAASTASVADESESKTRQLGGWWQKAGLVIAAVYSGYYLWTAEFGIHSPEAHRGLYWGFAGVLVFLWYPISKRKLDDPKHRRVPFYDLLLAGIVAGLTGYFVLNYQSVVLQGGFLEDYQFYLGWTAVIVSLEVTRRVVGWTLPIIGITAIIYVFMGPSMPGLLAHRGFDAERFLSTMFTSFNGLFGPVTHIFATFVFIFIVFGAFLAKSGAGQFFIDLPFAIAGSARG
jgi:TRAP-type uncharacterized transport system fused permease subunit